MLYLNGFVTSLFSELVTTPNMAKALSSQRGHSRTSLGPLAGTLQTLPQRCGFEALAPPVLGGDSWWDSYRRTHFKLVSQAVAPPLRLLHRSVTTGDMLTHMHLGLSLYNQAHT